MPTKTHRRPPIPTQRATLAIDLHGELPTEFRLFKAGVNSTEKGDFLFDGPAAKAVMAAYRKWGVDLAIDLEHQMLDATPTEPTHRDARGWFKLELRAGELWAVNVRWTPDGKARLRAKTQRYVSPAFDVDTGSRRITKVVNCAITALPATHGTPALVAASARKGRMKAAAAPEPEEVLEEQTDQTSEVQALAEEALVALEAEDLARVAELLEEIVGTPAVDTPPEPDAEPAAEMTSRRTDRRSLALQREAETLARDRAEFDGEERDRLMVKVALAVGPAVAWADPMVATNTALRTPAEPYASLSLPALRAAVDRLAGLTQRNLLAGRVQLPTGALQTASGPITLSAREVAYCKRSNIDPAKYAETRAAILARSNRTGV